MRNPFLEVIEIRPRPARALLAWMASLLALALLAIALADMPTVIRAAASAGAVVGAFFEYYRLFGPHGVVPSSATLRPDGRWSLVPARGARIDACLVRAWGGGLGPVVALEWRAFDRRRYRAWVTRRELSSFSDWRRLRVRLRFA